MQHLLDKYSPLLLFKYSMRHYLNIWPIGVHVSSNILQNFYIKRPRGIAEARSCNTIFHQHDENFK